MTRTHASLRIQVLLSLLALLVSTAARAAEAPPDVKFESETLDNGLHVIYAPLSQAPVVHVRVLYHVGSRDERPDRQGFAHMFEHMMFRGSEHVKPEEHMKLIMQVGGSSNAFTSYDQTTYVNTVPSNHVEMALYLEADRMASFKVSDEVFKTERNVVAEEWRLRVANQPYGDMGQEFAKLAFQKHSYRWTPIGDMDQLRQANSSELQDFFNTYYVPNNACLVIAGDIEVPKAKELVRKYFAWIPKGDEVKREIPSEPRYTQARRSVVVKPSIPLASVSMGFPTPGWRDEDHDALDMLGSILGSGGGGFRGGGGGSRTGRLSKLLVSGSDPKCVSVSARSQQLEDPYVFSISARLLQQAEPDEVEKIIVTAINELIEKGVTTEELDKAKTQRRIRMIRGRETATSIATMLGEEAVFGGDANRVNEQWQRIDRLTPADIQSVAKKYLRPERMIVLQYLPQQGARTAEASPATQPANGEKAAELAAAPVAASPRPVTPRQISFPEDYPQRPPISTEIISKTFEKGAETEVNGVKVIVMTDDRTPLVNWSLNLRAGGHAVPPGKEGLANITAQMLRRGAADLDYHALSEDLESRGISIDANDGGDVTRFGGSCPKDQLDHAILRARQILFEPAFAEEEFAKVKRQTIAGLLQSLSSPGVVGGRELNKVLWGDSPLGRQTTLESLGTITIDDVKNWYTWVYKPNDAILIFSGDITAEHGKAMAEKLLASWEKGDKLPTADYHFPDAPSSRKIVLVDNPEGKQAAIRMAVRGFDIRSEDKFPGAVASRILSDGIHARLDRYVRAEKGYTYGSNGVFQAGRHAGEFQASADTDLRNTADCIEAMIKVFNDMRTSAPPTDIEMTEAKTRTAGSMVMQMQTIASQAERRVDQILNDYPIDYYDVYPQRINEVTPDQVTEVMKKYVKDDQFVIVVVAPANQVKQQLERLGPVEVVAMPAAARAGQMMRPRGGGGEEEN